jgi:hypothetical protein
VVPHHLRRRINGSPLSMDVSQLRLQSDDLGLEHDIVVIHAVELLLAIFVHSFKMQRTFLPAERLGAIFYDLKGSRFNDVSPNRS